jgi:DNA-binding GntR family transcriptional regulator
MLPRRVRDLERLGRMSSIERSYRETAKDYAYRIIRDSIVNFGKKPGETISDMEISQQLGISRTPVREAIMKLKGESDIIDIFPQRGMRVALIDMDLVRQARLLRVTLEKEVAMDCCDYASPDDITRLEENLALQEFFCGRGMFRELFQKDNEFHHELFCISRNEMLYRVVAAVSIHYDRVRNLESEDLAHSQNTIADHRAILDAVQAGDRERAGREIENHLGRYLMNVKGLIEKYPEYFVPQDEHAGLPGAADGAAGKKD